MQKSFFVSFCYNLENNILRHLDVLPTVIYTAYRLVKVSKKIMLIFGLKIKFLKCQNDYFK